MKKLTAGIAMLLLAVLAFGQLGTVSVKTADYAVLPADHGSIIIMNSASARTIYLPGPSPSQIGMTITVQKRGSGNVTIAAAAADYIADSGVGQYVRNTTAGETYASITLVYAQANRWQIQSAAGTWSTDASTWRFGAGSIALSSLSSTATGLTYTPATGVFSLTANYVIPTTAEQSNWTTAYGYVDQSVKVAASPAFRGLSLAYAKPITAGASDDYAAGARETPSYVGDGIIATVAINAGGSLYHVNDVLTLAGGTGGQVTVSTINGDQHVDSITIDTPGTGYTVSTQDCSGGAGSGFVADITAVDGVDGHLDTVGISVAGLGYHVGDLLDVAGGTGGKLAVATVDGTGAVTAVTVSAGGLGYDATAAHATTGGAGSGCTIDILTLTTRTIARHNYFDLLTPAVSKGAAVTDGAVFRFDAAAGTHKALAAAAGFATLGWAKVNVNGTLGYVPVMSSTSTAGGTSAPTPVVTKSTDANLLASEMNSVVYATATATITLPEASTLAVGTTITVVSTTAAAVHVDPNAADLLIVDGVEFTAGQKASSSSGAGDSITLQYYTAGKWMMLGRVGTWTNGG